MFEWSNFLTGFMPAPAARPDDDQPAGQLVVREKPPPPKVGRPDRGDRAKVKASRKAARRRR